MNQILFVKDENFNKKSDRINRKGFVFKIQFIISILILFTLATLYLYFRYINQTTSDNYASKLSNNYQVYRLYSDGEKTSENSALSNYVIGNIDIPSINISYPILSTLTDELLKISPCRFYGDISDNSNLCIASHNFDNDSFFSKIKYLDIGDEIFISDNSNNKYNFIVFDNYEVDSSDLSPIYNVSNVFKKELTLVTCNNQNNKRIIVKARLL